tara:strand:+ start:514 stop:645 length:132 start_codon:yes stop_codon:yes gene_type:complete
MYLFYVWGYSFAGFASEGKENLSATCDAQIDNPDKNSFGDTRQ